jgi:hypothetical protein
VLLQTVTLRSRLNIPEPYGAIRTSADKHLSVRGEVHAEDRASVASQAEQLLAAAKVPEPHAGIIRAAGDALTIGRSRDAPHRSDMTG